MAELSWDDILAAIDREEIEDPAIDYHKGWTSKRPEFDHYGNRIDYRGIAKAQWESNRKNDKRNLGD